MGKIELKDLCGKHIFSGCELTSTKRIVYGYEGDSNVCLFTLDGVTYKISENLDDGYRSYHDEVVVSENQPRYTFPGIEVVCSMMDNDKSGEHDVLVVRDASNGEIILKVGTKYIDDYYPYCLFEYTPENMACNKKAKEEIANG